MLECHDRSDEVILSPSDRYMQMPWKAPSHKPVDILGWTLICESFIPPHNSSTPALILQIDMVVMRKSFFPRLIDTCRRCERPRPISQWTFWGVLWTMHVNSELCMLACYRCLFFFYSCVLIIGMNCDNPNFKEYTYGFWKIHLKRWSHSFPVWSIHADNVKGPVL